METLIEPRHTAPLRSRVRPAPAIEVDERAARRSLRRQVGELERQLSGLAVAAFPRTGLAAGRAVPGAGPRLLSLGELERLRDGLADRVADERAALARRTAAEEAKRGLVERMLRDPAAYRFVRVTREEIGERGCGAWEVRPRLGLIGMLAGWWQVKLSSGCP